MNGHALKNWHYCEGARKSGTSQECPKKHRVHLGGRHIRLGGKG